MDLNTIFGFKESFVSDHYCRICCASKFQAFFLCEKDEKLIRNTENYTEDLKTLSNGIKSECVFNGIPYFHIAENIICDLMHDIYLGVARYDMASVINYLIDKNYITLNHLNNRLKYFDYAETDRGNKVSYIFQKHLQKGQLIRTAAEMSFLISYFSIIVGDVVPDDDPVWEFYLTL